METGKSNKVMDQILKAIQCCELSLVVINGPDEAEIVISGCPLYHTLGQLMPRKFWKRRCEKRAKSNTTSCDADAKVFR